uniref:EGF-like domain-containing protein n=1 Tax=Parastrongyloides trichosuri TaxID=131310 RepID=A0A0N4ZIX6_PARTI
MITSVTKATCKTKEPIYHHDGMNGNGEKIMVGVSKNCDETFSFPVDSSMIELYILIDSLSSGYPIGELYNASNYEIMPCSDQNIENYGYIARYCNIFDLNGGGTFNITVSSYDNNPCSLSVFSKTTIVGDGDGSSIGNEGVHKNPYINETSYFAFQMTGITNGTVKTVNIITNIGSNLTYNVMERINCTANNYVGPFTCQTKGFNSMFLNGIDDKGYNFQRFYIFNCIEESKTTEETLTTPSSGINICFNNGTLINSQSSEPYCVCTEYFTGPQCEYKVCFNDGTLGPDQRCICANYWSGEFCQDMICSDISDHDYYNKNHALTFIVRTSKTIESYRESILNSAIEIVSSYGLKDSSYFVKFVLVNVVNGYVVEIGEYDFVEEFYDGIMNMVWSVDNSCIDNIGKALSITLRSNTLSTYPLSPVIVFSDVLPGDDDETKGELLNELAFFQGPIFFILLTSPITNCLIDTSNENYKYLLSIAQMTQGLVSKIDNEKDAYIISTNIMANYYNAGTLLQNDFVDSCTYAPKNETFIIDSSINSFAVLLSGNNVNFNVSFPYQEDLSPINVISVGDTKIAIYRSTSFGKYMFKITEVGSGPCQYRIFAATPYKLLYGTSGRIIDDIDSKMPIFNEDYNIVGKIEEFHYTNDTIKLKMESSIWTNNDNTGLREVLYTSEGKFRSGCSYHFFFSSWRCMKREMKFYLDVFVTDTITGNTIQRTKSGFCAAFIPTPIPPSGCQNGGVIINNSTCVCTPNYTGDKCQNLICQNDGISKNGYCECRGLYTGKFCDRIECSNENTYETFPKARKSLTFILHESMSTRTMLSSLVQNSNKMIQDITNQHKDFISYYQVISFNDNNSTTYVDSSDPIDFVNGLQKLYNDSMYNEELSCERLNLYSPMQKVLFDPNTSKYGYFYVFINGIPYANDTIFVEAKNFLDLLTIQLNIVQISGAPCGYTLEGTPEMRDLLSLASATEGTFYNIQSVLAGKVLETIPSQYSSQIIYENYLNNCSGGENIIYFPIDSESQSFTVNIHGNLIDDPIYYAPSGSTYLGYSYSSVVNIFSDYAYGSRVDRVIRPCDDDWMSFNGHCWLFVDDYVDWDSARKSCGNVNSFLGTIYDKKDQDFLDKYSGDFEFWIGLNDIKNNGTFVWDQNDNNPLPLSTNSFTNWGPNEPNLSHNCIYDSVISLNNSSRGWKSASCTDKKYYVCVKHAYNSTYTPKDPSNDLLPKGQWSVKLQSVTGICHVKITTQTNIRIFNTFTQNKFDDYGSPGPSMGNNVINYMLTHATGLDDKLDPNNIGKLQSLRMVGLKNSSLLGVGTFNERYNCLYQYVSTEIECQVDSFKVVVTGIDKYGYTFQRIRPVSCSNVRVKGNCDNGGVPLENNCFCSFFWTGTNCDIIQCLYGRPSDTYDRCICDEGYTGTHCTIAVCTRRNGNNTSGLEDDNKAFILGIDGEKFGEMSNVIDNLEELLLGIIDNANFIDPQKFTRFIGIVFRDSSYKVGDSLSKVINTNDKNIFIEEIKNDIEKNPYISKSNPHGRLILEGLINALSDCSIPSNSQAYILTNSYAEDYNMLENALNQIAFKHTKVDVIIIGDKNLPGNISISDERINSLFKISYFSGGNFYQVANYEELVKFWNSLLGTEINTYAITRKSCNECVEMIEYIQMGSKGTLLALDIYITGKDSKIEILDPNNDNVTISGEVKTQTNWLILIRTSFEDQLIPGVWKVKLITNVESYFHMHARVLEDNPPHIAFSSDVAEDGGRHSDYSVQYPIIGYNTNAIVAETPFGTLTYAQVHDLTDNILLWSSSFISRENCGFKYITEDLFSCTTPTFIVSINGIDDDGHSFRMIKTIHCDGFRNASMFFSNLCT